MSPEGHVLGGVAVDSSAIPGSGKYPSVKQVLPPAIFATVAPRSVTHRDGVVAVLGNTQSRRTGGV